MILIVKLDVADPGLHRHRHISDRWIEPDVLDLPQIAEERLHLILRRLGCDVRHLDDLRRAHRHCEADFEVSLTLGSGDSLFRLYTLSTFWTIFALILTYPNSRDGNERRGVDPHMFVKELSAIAGAKINEAANLRVRTST